MSELKLIPAIPELPSEIYKAHLNKKLAILVKYMTIFNKK